MDILFEEKAANSACFFCGDPTEDYTSEELDEDITEAFASKLVSALVWQMDTLKLPRQKRLFEGRVPEISWLEDDFIQVVAHLDCSSEAIKLIQKHESHLKVMAVKNFWQLPPQKQNQVKIDVCFY